MNQPNQAAASATPQTVAAGLLEVAIVGLRVRLDGISGAELGIVDCQISWGR